MLFPQTSAPRGKTTNTSLKDFGLSRPGPQPLAHEADALTTGRSSLVLSSKETIIIAEKEINADNQKKASFLKFNKNCLMK